MSPAFRTCRACGHASLEAAHRCEACAASLSGTIPYVVEPDPQQMELERASAARRQSMRQVEALTGAEAGKEGLRLLIIGVVVTGGSFLAAQMVGASTVRVAVGAIVVGVLMVLRALWSLITVIGEADAEGEEEADVRGPEPEVRGPEPDVRSAPLYGSAARVVAVDVTEPLRFYQRAVGWGPDATAAVGRLMSAAAALAIVRPGQARVTVTVRGNGRYSPVQVGYDAREGRYTVAVRLVDPGQDPRADGGLSTARAVGDVGMFSVQFEPSGERAEVSLCKGEIGDELADLLALRMGKPGAAIIGEFLLPEGVKGSGLVLLWLEQDADDADRAFVEAAVGRFGLLSQRIKAGEGGAEWLASLPAFPAETISFR